MSAVLALHRITCPQCHGLTELRTHDGDAGGSDPCGHCDERGFMESEYEPEASCRLCYGTGRVRHNRDVCGRCDGLGRV